MKTFIEIYVPLCLPILQISLEAQNRQRRAKASRLTAQELSLFMVYSELCTMLTRPVLSKSLIDSAEELVAVFRKQIYHLHPGTVNLPNLHNLSHICEDARRFGPINGLWNFGMERRNYENKTVNQNNRPGQMETIMMTASGWRNQLFGVIGDLLNQNQPTREQAANQLARHVNKGIKGRRYELLGDDESLDDLEAMASLFEQRDSLPEEFARSSKSSDVVS